MAAQAGFDYIELPIAKLVDLSEDEFNTVKNTINNSGIKCEAGNIFFPRELKIVGPDVDKKKITEHAKKASERLGALGAKAAVLGSGSSRMVPEGWSMEKAIEQFSEAAAIIGSETSRYGVVTVLEHLNKTETNFLNSVSEALDLARKLNLPNVQLLVDLYHMRRESEDMDIIPEAGKLLKHAHIANSHGRVYPLNSGEEPYEVFFVALKKAGYDERISIEASTNDFENDSRNSLKFLRSLVK